MRRIQRAVAWRAFTMYIDAHKQLIEKLLKDGMSPDDSIIRDLAYFVKIAESLRPPLI